MYTVRTVSSFLFISDDIRGRGQPCFWYARLLVAVVEHTIHAARHVNLASDQWYL